MEPWLTSSLEIGYIAAVDSAAVTKGVFCEASPSPWYDDGVVFDWTTLHQRLVSSPSSSALPYADTATAALARFGCEAASRAARAGTECFATVVELKAPWSLNPLSDQAQSLSLFDVAVTKDAPPSAPTRAFYTFRRGPPGQRAVREDMTRVLASVETQLRQGGLQAFRFLSSFVIVCGDFRESLQDTAAVFRALSEVGFTVDGHGSSLGPRSVQRLRVKEEDWWTTLPLQKLTSEEDVAGFVVALFFQWLQDAYAWGCTAPLHLFPDAATDAVRGGASVGGKGVQLLETFVRGLLLPCVHAIGFTALRASLPEEGGSLWELTAVKLERKVPPVGPQRWSVLELRLVLCQIHAYRHLPSEYLSEATTAGVPVATAAATAAPQ